MKSSHLIFHLIYMAAGSKEHLVHQEASYFCCFSHDTKRMAQPLNDARKDQVPLYIHRFRIESGYRKGYDWNNVALSLFAFHNETGNIWTHLIPVFGFTAWWMWFWITWDGDFWDGVMLHISIVAALATFVLSTFYHLTCCISEQVCNCGLSLDIGGIAVTIVGTYFAQCTFFFYKCYFHHWLFYVLVSLSFGAVGAALRPFIPWIHQLMFSITVLFSIVPLIHYLKAISDFEPVEYDFWFYDVFALEVGGILCFVIGFVVYWTCFPEVFSKSGRFDLVGHSHQLWHLFVNIALILMAKASYAGINRVRQLGVTPFCQV